MSRAILRCFRNMFLPTGRRSPTLNRHRLLQHEQPGPRYLLSLYRCNGRFSGDDRRSRAHDSNAISNNVISNNVISGNAKTGITISGAATTNNVIEGNRIGTNLNGNTGVPNAGDGIRVINAANTRIGSATDALARNVPFNKSQRDSALWC